MTDLSSGLLREMRGEDIEPLAEALDLAWERIDKRWQELLAGWREVLVAEVEGAPVGTVSVNERPEQPGLLHLFALDVAPAERNRGIGTRLVKFVEAVARRRGLSGIYLEVGLANVDARRLYERLGYQPDGKPFPNSWVRYGAGGQEEEVVEEMQRMVKLFS